MEGFGQLLLLLFPSCIAMMSDAADATCLGEEILDRHNLCAYPRQDATRDETAFNGCASS